MAKPLLLDLDEKELKKYFRQTWDKGLLSQDWLEPQSLFPLVLPIRQPTGAQWREHLLAYQERVRNLEALEQRTPLKVEWVFQATTVGNQRLPNKVMIENREDFLSWLKLEHDFEEFVEISQLLLDTFPILTTWVTKNCLKLLEYPKQTWQKFIAVCQSLERNPRPNIYLRELDISGVDTKFVEQHQGLLKALLDLILPPEAIDSGIENLRGQGFARRFGLRSEEALIRFRVLDPELRLHPKLSDLSVPLSEFASLNPTCRWVWICENLTTYLSFPALPQSWLIFGSGRAVELLKEVPWLESLELMYWGDLDTHGFAILTGLRRHFPQLRSLLMDAPTLETHRDGWVHEDRPAQVHLELLSPAEKEACQILIEHKWGQNLRLEQEKISQSYLLDQIQLQFGLVNLKR